MTDETEYKEVGADGCIDEFNELEIEVIAAQHQADCHDHSGCAGSVLILIIAVFGALVFLF